MNNWSPMGIFNPVLTTPAERGDQITIIHHLQVPLGVREQLHALGSF